MTHLRLATLAAAAVALTLSPHASAQSIIASTFSLVVDTSSGEAFLNNTGTGFQIFDGYEIDSPSSGLLPSAWTPIAGNFDAAGNGSVDATQDWILLSSTPSSLAEASPTVLSAAVLPGAIVPLGAIWDTGSARDLGAVGLVASTASPITVLYQDLRADYNGDLLVTQADYTLFSLTYGSTTDLRADGNGDGAVNAADYTIWRDSPELRLGMAQVSTIQAAPGLAVPEPSSLCASLLGLGSAAALCRGRRQGG